jgi:hypothetical protein
MNETELFELEKIHAEILTTLRKKHGDDRVQFVDDLEQEITTRMMNGEQIEGIHSWAYEIVEEFVSLLRSHPHISYPALN